MQRQSSRRNTLPPCSYQDILFIGWLESDRYRPLNLWWMWILYNHMGNRRLSGRIIMKCNWHHSYVLLFINSHNELRSVEVDVEDKGSTAAVWWYHDFSCVFRKWVVVIHVCGKGLVNQIEEGEFVYTDFEQLKSFGLRGKSWCAVIDILHGLQQFVIPCQTPLLLLEKVLVSVLEASHFCLVAAKSGGWQWREVGNCI